MTDNVVLNPGFGGDVVAADDINGVLHQRVKVEFGDSDAATQVSSGNPLPVRLVVTGSVPTTLFKHLRYGGTGSLDLTSGSQGATSGSPAYFLIAPAPGEVYRIARLIGELEAVGTISSGKYGDQTALTNGLELQIMSGSAPASGNPTGSWTPIQNLTDQPIQNNIDWGHYCYDIQFFNAAVGPAGNDFMLWRWTFSKTGAPLRLDGNNNEALVLIIRDDVTSLVHNEFSIQGIVETQLT